jgi:ABC-type sugar transport system permease subunit
MTANRSLQRTLRRHGGDILLVSPFLALFAVFGVWPVLRSAWLSFTSYHATHPPVWVGARNYAELWADERFWQALGNTLTYMAAVSTLSMAMGLVLALAFGSQSRLHQFARIIFFLPSVAGGVGAISAWKWMAHSESYGLFNSVRGFFGLAPIRFLGDPHWSMVVLVAVGVWTVIGYNMIIFVAGMRAIPGDLYEAATLDGAGRWQRFLRITLPLLRPTLAYVLVTGMIASFQVFYEPYLLYGSVDAVGGPLDSALMLVTYLFDYGFRQLELGLASAAAWVLTTLLFGLTWINMKLTRSGEAN